MSSVDRVNPPGSRRWVWLAIGWTLFGAVQALLRSALGVRSDSSLLNAVVQVVVLAAGWALLTPVVGAWHQRAATKGRHIAVVALWHLPMLAVAAVLVTLLRRAMILVLGAQLSVPFEVTLAYFADLTITSYLAAIWASRTLDSFAALVAEEQRTSALRSQLMASQMEYLDLQLRPHFLFNALGTIAELAHEAPRVAARMLENVIALLESAVARRGGGLVTLDEELQALSPYLDIQRLRFADWLVIDLAVEPASRAALVPPFILQPLVENAVHHGLLRRTERGHITIAALVSGGRLRISVTDNGAGLAMASYQESRGLGLANIRARLATFYGDRSTLDLRREAAGGTTAQLDVPLEHTRPAPVPGPMPRDELRERGASSGIVTWISVHPVMALVIAWTAVAVFRIQHSLGYLWLRDRFTPEAFQSAIRYDVVVAVVWLALTPLVVAFSRAVPVRGAAAARTVGVHALAAGVFAFSHTLLTRAIAQGAQTPLWQGLDAELYAWNVAVYVILFLVVHYRTLEGWLREREVTAQRLRVELQEARLNRVMLELRPAMLFDVLRYLVTLVQTSPRVAETRLAELGDFLRATLDAMRHHEIPLQQELAGVRAYVRLLALATHPGASVQVEQDSGIGTDAVPNGILRAAVDAVLAAGAPVAAPALHLSVRRIGDGLQIAAWRSPAPGGALQPLTEQISGYLEHGLAEAAWTDGQLLLRT